MLLTLVLAPLLIALGFFLPGWLLHRVLPSPSPLLGSFLGSTLILFLLALLLQVTDLPLTEFNLAVATLVACLILLWQGRRLRRTAAPGEVTASGARSWVTALWIGAAVIAVIATVARAVADPLSGWDNYFRWNGLALLTAEQGSWSFYPPVTAADYAIYPWPEGIPLMIPLLNFWIYSAVDSFAREFIAIRVAIETGVLFLIVRQFATEVWGTRDAGWAATALLATSALAGWSLSMAQETGYSALALIGLVHFLVDYRRTGATSSLIWAALAAAAGALTRDFWLIFIPLGAVILLLDHFRKPPSAPRPPSSVHRPPAVAKSMAGKPSSVFGLPFPVLLYSAVALATALPWYIRNAWLTGNPLFSQNLAGLLPVNDTYVTVMRTGRGLTPWSQVSPWDRPVFLNLTVTAGALLLAGVIGWIRLRRPGIRPAVSAGAFCVAGVWLWTVASPTFGGFSYSTRLLAPLLALAAVGAGWVGTWSSKPARATAAFLALFLAFDAAARALYLPGGPLVKWSQMAWGDAARMKEASLQFRTPDLWRRVAEAADGQPVIVDHPNYHGLLKEAGGNPVSFFSPVAAPLFDSRLSRAEVLAALRANGVRFVVLARGNPFTPRIAGLRDLAASMETLPLGPLDVFDLTLGPFK